MIQGKTYFILLRDFDSLYLEGGANISCFDVLNKESTTNWSRNAPCRRSRGKLCCREKQERYKKAGHHQPQNRLTHIEGKVVKHKTNWRQ